MPFLPQSASHRTSVDKYSPYTALSSVLTVLYPVEHRRGTCTDCQIRPRDPPTDPMVQLCPVIQEVWDAIPQARSTHLGPFIPQRCRVVHGGHGLPQPLLTLLHLAVRCTEPNATINFCLANDDSRQIAILTHTKQFLWAVFTIIRFPVEIGVRFFFVQYIRGFVFLFCIAERWFVDSINRFEILYAA